MMNKFIKLKMHNSRNGGGSFIAEASFKIILDKEYVFRDAIVKIDTGCTVSVLTLKRLMEDNLVYLKNRDIVNNVPSMLSYGVESIGTEHHMPVTVEEKMKCSALKFKHDVSEFVIGGVNLGRGSIFVNYDRTSNILIGLDILKTWDIHIGNDESGETILLACPYSQINDEYLLELERIFKIGTIVSSANVRNEI